MGFVRFMRSIAGRLLRSAAGIALIVIGLLVVGGTGGMVTAVIGVVPLFAGVITLCLLGPLLRLNCFGRPKSRAV